MILRNLLLSIFVPYLALNIAIIGLLIFVVLSKVCSKRKWQLNSPKVISSLVTVLKSEIF